MAPTFEYISPRQVHREQYLSHSLTSGPHMVAVTDKWSGAQRRRGDDDAGNRTGKHTTQQQQRTESD